MRTLQIRLETSQRFNVFFVFLFIYFLTVPAELLNLKVSLFKLRVNHVLGLWLFVTLIFSQYLRIADRKLFIGFLLLLSSFVFSAIQGVYPYRSFGYVLVALFTYAVYFLLPLNIMLLFDSQKILRLYFASFLVVGIHAALQLLLSLVGIIDPFVTQYVDPGMGTGVVRGQAMTYEPSFYALYAVPFVTYANIKYLLVSRWDFSSFFKIIGINMLLLLSTSTGAFFSYFVFCSVGFFAGYFPPLKMVIKKLRRNLLMFMGAFAAIFCTTGMLFKNIFIITFYKFFKVGFFSHWSFLERWKGIVDAWDIFCQFPIFGLGLGGVGYYQCMHAHREKQSQLYTPTLDLLGPFDPTNMFTEVLASLGLYGLLAFSYFGWIIYQIVHKLLKHPLVPLKEKQTAIALLLSVIVMFACLQFNQGLFRSYIWTHVGIFVGYCLKTTSSAESKGPLI